MHYLEVTLGDARGAYGSTGYATVDQLEEGEGSWGPLLSVDATSAE